MDKNVQSEDVRPNSGKTSLLIGGGISAYGTTLALTAGYVCPVCIIAAPAFLGVGAWQAVKARAHENAKKEAD